MKVRKQSRRLSSFSCSTTVTDAETVSLQQEPVTICFSREDEAVEAAAVRIQSRYRGHLVRSLCDKILVVRKEAIRLQNEIQRQQTVDAIRSSERERIRIDEELMALLIKLDSVPGLCPAVREARRTVSSQLVGLQEIVDGVCRASEEDCRYGWWWDETVEEIEADVCRENGGDEMESFCAQYLGFRCLQRFLHES